MDVGVTVRVGVFFAVGVDIGLVVVVGGLPVCHGGTIPQVFLPVGQVIVPGGVQVVGLGVVVVVVVGIANCPVGLHVLGVGALLPGLVTFTTGFGAVLVGVPIGIVFLLAGALYFPVREINI